jgi:hypothetical protein
MTDKVKTVRNCDTCYKCCEGWLIGSAREHEFYPGKPCHFMKPGSGCSIYHNRPEEPCKSYHCEYIVNEDIPEWFRPDNINAIITKRKVDDIEYLDVAEAGSRLDVRVLNWLMSYCFNNERNAVYKIDGGLNFIGTSQFITAYKESHTK